MLCTEIVDTGLEGADSINRLLSDERFVLQLALILVGIGALKLIIDYFSTKNDISEEVSKLDKSLIDSLADKGYDADGNRIDGYPDNEEDLLFERRDTNERSQINSGRIPSRHYTGERSFGRRVIVPHDDKDTSE